MIEYEYRCPEHGVFTSDLRHNRTLCPVSRCSSMGKRVFSFRTTAPTRVFTPHFNYTVGEYVSSPQQFNDALKKINDRTGQNLTPFDVHDYTPTTDATYLAEKTKSDIRQGGSVANKTEEELVTLADPRYYTGKDFNDIADGKKPAPEELPKK